ncbi:MAG: AAA family ATPase [Cyanosarcina radialis HA8281-LM2]|jgi:predicted kinase|nr:AAA family ATPase [Cyanosarcina radialis HA8281-LM2]
MILLIGLPGSGKSSLAQQMVVEDPQRQPISTDAIRDRLFGDESIQGSWPLVRERIQQQLQAAVSSAVPEVIYDATNAHQQHRREAIALGRNCGCDRITGIWLDLPVDRCLESNRERSRQVPEEIIWQMYRQLVLFPPSIADGLDCLIRCHTGGTDIAIASIYPFRYKFVKD